LNAGFQESWSWKVRETVRTDPGWHFSHLDGPEASWIDAKQLAGQKRILPGPEFDRLWMNVWSAGSGDALSEQDLLAAVNLPGPSLQRQPGLVFFGGVDLAETRDHAAVALVGRTSWTARRRLQLVRLHAWKPPIDLLAVKETVRQLHAQYRPRWLFDASQAASMRQELQAEFLFSIPFVCDLMRYTGAQTTELASILLQCFRDRVIDLYDDAQLLTDLRQMRLRSSAAGWRLESPRTRAGGHGDRAAALTLALLCAYQHPHSQDYSSLPLPEVLIPGRAPEAMFGGAEMIPKGRTGALGFGGEYDLRSGPPALADPLADAFHGWVYHPPS
jgi:hypothetical protein